MKVSRQYVHRVLNRFVQARPDIVFILFGFGQGGLLAADAAASFGTQLGGVISFGGGLFLEEMKEPISWKQLQLPMLALHATHGAAIPFESVQYQYQTLQGLGMNNVELVEREATGEDLSPTAADLGHICSFIRRIQLSAQRKQQELVTKQAKSSSQAPMQIDSLPQTNTSQSKSPGRPQQPTVSALDLTVMDVDTENIVI